jgi:hypothetical protein
MTASWRQLPALAGSRRTLIRPFLPSTLVLNVFNKTDAPIIARYVPTSRLIQEGHAGTEPHLLGARDLSHDGIALVSWGHWPGWTQCRNSQHAGGVEKKPVGVRLDAHLWMTIMRTAPYILAGIASLAATASSSAQVARLTTSEATLMPNARTVHVESGFLPGDGLIIIFGTAEGAAG